MQEITREYLEVEGEDVAITIVWNGAERRESFPYGNGTIYEVVTEWEPDHFSTKDYDYYYDEEYPDDPIFEAFVQGVIDGDITV